MTDNEKRACLHLKVRSNSNINKYFVKYEDSETRNDSFSEYLKQVEKSITVDSVPQYINWNFILRNITEVERLWNITCYILRGERARKGVKTFEAPMGFKHNRELWNLNDIPKENTRAGEDRALSNHADEIGAHI